ncbi:energy transducer TonB [Rhizorhabdus sp.]|uniref:energy transducer TonB n=1 Tax=Rhizorhabdus sp. TaxID=1968843 RepID=UPI0019A61A6E|nr:energy transducer TonB [Rhizorhabdus sp.]MBD3761076.1 energy transducer TonB [Rhizorhabdus sp.]
MAYGDQTMSTRKAVSIAMVIVLHAIIGYAFVTGLAYNVVKKVARDLKTFDVEEEAPPPPDKPPPPPPETRVEPPPVVAPPPIVQVAPSVAPPMVTVPSPPPPQITPSAPPAPPPPAVSRKLEPRGTPGEWVTPEDYPSADLRAENQGTTSFELAIGADGKATDCRVTNSSGFPSLDAKACQMLLRRSRFRAQLDGNGQPMPATYRNRVRWQIPKD